MDNMQKEKEQEQGFGRLPAMAPLANPYVPFQLENPPKYEARKGLVRGTLYPGLELPFMGMVNKNELPVSPMSELQALAFAIQELALYLDTHREDREALAAALRAYNGRALVDGRSGLEPEELAAAAAPYGAVVL